MSKKGIILILFIFSMLSLGSYSLLSAYYQVKTRGVIYVSFIGIQGYFDAECIIPVNSIDWGTLEPGNNEIQVIYLLNNGTVPEILDLTTENWNPFMASSFLFLSWNYTGTILQPSHVLPIQLSLSVSSDDIAIFEAGLKDFSFTVVIYATETN